MNVKSVEKKFIVKMDFLMGYYSQTMTIFALSVMMKGNNINHKKAANIFVSKLSDNLCVFPCICLLKPKQKI